MDLETTLFRIKCNRYVEKVGLRKKSKASKTFLDPITLTEGYLNNIDDTVRDATAELLQQFEL